MIFFKNEINPDNPSEITFEAVENSEICGSCRMIITDAKAVVKSISFDPDKLYIAEGLIKSAFNFATSKNCYMGYCECENFNGFLDRMNFEKSNGIYYNDIPTILMGNCCKKH